MIAAARAPLLLALLLLAGCLHHSTTSTDGQGSNVAAALAVSGVPPTDVITNSNYFFQPVAVAASDAAVTYSIAGKPDWLNFDTNTGVLSGSPTDAAVGTTGDIVIVAATASAAGTIGPFRIRVRRPGTTSTNTPLVISGSPSTSAQAGVPYSFTPTASDANGDTLTFQIQNKPAWASFNTSTGQLSGSPSSAAAGSYANVVISVTDGMASAALGAFTITVSAGAVASGSASVSWTLPTQNTDGTPLTDLAGFRVYYGNDPAALSRSVTLNGASNNRYVLSNLAPGTWYVTVRPFNTAGVEGDATAILSKTIG
jgi:hypothetical protein